MKTDMVDVKGKNLGSHGRSIRFLDGASEVLLPKCQCDWDEATQTMTVTRWVAERFGLTIR
jgi:hypothetical protein